MRIRREAAARTQLAPEVPQVLFGQPAFDERPRVDAGRRVALVEHDVGVAAAVAAAEEVIEPDFIERRRRRVRRDVTADAVRLAVGADDHRERVPAHEALDAALHRAVARASDLLRGRDRVDVRRVRRKRQPHARHPGARALSASSRRTVRALVALVQDVVERLQPLARFDRLERRDLRR